MKYQPPHFYHAWHGINHAFHFERYYHRALTSEERAIISALERQRQRGKGIRAVIHDPFLSLDALPDYFQWLTTVLFPKFDTFTAEREFAVLAPTKRLARRLVCDIKLPRKRTFTFSWRTPDAPRGLNIDHLLVLGWRARHKSIRRILGDYRPLQASLLPTVPAGGPYSVMIVISRDPLPHFSRLPAWSYLSTATDRRLSSRRQTAERFPHHYPHDSSWGNAPPLSPTAARLHSFPVEGQIPNLHLTLLTRRNAPLTRGEASLTFWPQGQKLNQAQIQRICA